MRVPDTIQDLRVKVGLYRSTPAYGCNGAFNIPFENNTLMVVISDQMGWEHVSVSLRNRCPNWREMCFIKQLFWGEDETVVQFHPKKSEYKNFHPQCLHMWKKAGEEYELPPSIMVAP